MVQDDEAFGCRYVAETQVSRREAAVANQSLLQFQNAAHIAESRGG